MKKVFLVGLFCISFVSLTIHAMGSKAKEQELRFIARYGGNIERAKELIDAGVNVNAQDDNGRTALMLTTKMGQQKYNRTLT